MTAWRIMWLCLHTKCKKNTVWFHANITSRLMLCMPSSRNVMVIRLSYQFLLWFQCHEIWMFLVTSVSCSKPSVCVFAVEVAVKCRVVIFPARLTLLVYVVWNIPVRPPNWCRIETCMYMCDTCFVKIWMICLMHGGKLNDINAIWVLFRQFTSFSCWPLSVYNTSSWFHNVW